MIIVEPGFVIEDCPSGDEILKKIERSGRVCYKSECNIREGTDKIFVKSLIDRQHESVIEHVSVTVRIICDRGVSHELVRHRIASYSQESTRYCDYNKTHEIQVIEPPGMNSCERTVWIQAMKAAEANYFSMRGCGSKPQIARSVLPHALKTEVVVTMNLRSWRHFFKMRTAKSAHPQMRQIAVPLLAEFKVRIPIIFDDLVAEE